jgi:hypothetical protein
MILACVRAPSPRAAPLTSAAPTTLAWHPWARASAFGRDARGAWQIVWGGARMLQHDEGVRLARERLDDAIEFAVPVTQGWVFVTVGAAVLTATEFLGTLTRQNLPGRAVDETLPLNVLAGQRGRVAFVTRDGRAFASDGGSLAPIASLVGRRVSTMAFRNASQGAAITEGGALWHTRDGGASWQAVAAAGAPWTGLTVRADALIAIGTVAHAVTDDGRLGDVPGAALGSEHDQPPPGWREALAALGPTWRDVSPSVPFPDGVEVFFEAAAARVVARESGRTLRRIDLPDGCRPDVSGPFVLLACPAHDLEESEYERWLDPRQGGALLREVPESVRRSRPSERPTLSVALGACDDPYPAAPHLLEPSTATSLCVITDPRRDGETLPLPAPVWALRGVFGGAALVQPDAHSLARVAVEGARPATLTPLWRVPGHDVTAAVGADGTVTAVARGAGRVRAWVSSRDGAGSEVPLPEGCERVVFVDPARGYAWRYDFRLLFRTRDRGDHWEPLPSPCVDDPLSDRSPEDPWIPEPLRCSDSRCLLDGQLAIVGWGPVEPTLTCVQTRPPPGTPSPDPSSPR